MKMRERVRAVAETAEAQEFVELWRRVPTGISAGDATRMTHLGMHLVRRVDAAVIEHGRASNGGGMVLRGATAGVRMLELERSREREVRRQMPELLEFMAVVKEARDQRAAPAAERPRA